MSRSKDIRLIITATPKTGNEWLKRLLAQLWNLPVIDLFGKTEVADLVVPDGDFVTHQHLRRSDELVRWGKEKKISFVTIVRHPAAVFLSYFHFLNNFRDRWEASGQFAGRPPEMLIGRALDSSKTAEYIERHFARVLEVSVGWLKEPGTPFVKYEDLHDRPKEVLRKLSAAIAEEALPTDENIERAVRASSLSEMRAISQQMQTHCRQGEAEAWRREMPAHLLAILTQICPPELRNLGYFADQEKLAA